MKLHFHPASATGRPVLQFAAESGIALDEPVTDMVTGEHYRAPFEAINPNPLVPVLEDVNFRLTASSAILKYLADKMNSPLHPKDLQQHARVNERMDWIKPQLRRDLVCGFVYPQIFPFHKRRSDEAPDATLAWRKERAQGWFKVLDQHILGARNACVCGEPVTLADYLRAAFGALGELTGGDSTAFPNAKRWLGRMKQPKNWKRVDEVLDDYVAPPKGNPMQAA